MGWGTWLLIFAAVKLSVAQVGSWKWWRQSGKDNGHGLLVARFNINVYILYFSSVSTSFNQQNHLPWSSLTSRPSHCTMGWLRSKIAQYQIQGAQNKMPLVKNLCLNTFKALFSLKHMYSVFTILYDQCYYYCLPAIISTVFGSSALNSQLCAHRTRMGAFQGNPAPGDKISWSTPCSEEKEQFHPPRSKNTNW